jgi:CDP-diacylglycerol--glycerol-3-phosphate 3-phosphatidyltransferase
MKKLPITLIYARLLIGLSIVLLSFLKIKNYEIIAIVLLTVGLMTDVFDGIIARKLNVSTPKLRRLDSNIDQVFFISFACATYLQCSDFFKENYVQLGILLGFEALAYFVCFLKFRKEIATHSLGAKIWTLFLFAALVQIIWQCQSPVLFPICFWLGLATRLEIIAIMLVLKKWTNDVPSLYHAVLLRHGKKIKRNKMFNG